MPQDQRVPQDGIAFGRGLGLSNLTRPSLVRNEILATSYIRRMRGGAHACLLRCSDGQNYVVKVQNNPQGKRILANELLGTLLARKLSLPVAEPAVINISSEFIQAFPEMVIHLGRTIAPMQWGHAFGSRVPHHGEPSSSRKAPLQFVHEIMPGDGTARLANVSDVAGMLVFDKWTCNTDGRQVIFVQDTESAMYGAIMIDQGFCFNGVEWKFPDSPRHCVGLYGSVFDRIPSFFNFEPWLDYLESVMNRDVLETAARQIPPEWYHNDLDALRRLLDWLDVRRTRVSDLVYPVWKTYRQNLSSRTFVRNCSSSPGSNESKQLSFTDLQNW